MRTLLSAKSVVELLAGMALMLVPSMVVSLALGVPVELPAGLVLARCTGAILLAVGIACWVERDHSESRGAIGLIVALLVYDVSIVVLLLVARLSEHLSGIVLWPAVFLHSGLGAWSLLCLTKKPRRMG
jgi:Kef-type K+ transport system membrane component KefB